MDIKKAKIGNAITSVADNHVVAVANDIYDETQEKYQSEINNNVQDLTDDYNDFKEDTDKVLIKQFSEIAFSSSVNLFEKGVSTTVVLNWNYKYNGENMTPDDLLLTDCGGDLVTDRNVKTYTQAITDTVTYHLYIINHGVDFEKTLTVRAVEAIYAGASLNGTMNSATWDMVTNAIKRIATTPAGKYNVQTQDEDYIWICVPKSLGKTISRVTCSLIEVPMESPVTYNGYLCYRTSKSLVRDTYALVVE